VQYFELNKEDNLQTFSIILEFCLIKYWFNLVTGIRYRAHFSLCQETNYACPYKTEGVGGGSSKQVFKVYDSEISVLFPLLCQKV